MRSFVVFLLFALFAVVTVLAKKSDLECVPFSDDCGKCVSNDCVWCSDGYCASAQSDVCEAHKVSTSCSSSGNKIELQPRPRADQDCESITSCDACTAPCFKCVDNNYKIFKCSTSSTCVATGYLQAYEWWVAALGLPGVSFNSTADCPVVRLPAANSPVLTLTIVATLFGSTPSCDGLQPIVIIARILALLQATLPPPLFDASGIQITSCTVTKQGKRQEILQGTYEVNVLVKFADMNGFSAQGVVATLLEADKSDVFTVDSGSPVTAQPYLPTSTATGQAITRGHKGNNNASLSKGALAGIIIGSILFGAVLVALIMWFILRGSRSSASMAFRSPAAAYRP